ncbi:beta-Ala-His dipeptidase [Peptacetobacter sp. AB845]|uniref:beta-Ala-His dipeptidase n=1 Tax=Peptacetobacter sp. AB845 TaxID=3388429 RepID=UPI0039C91E2E
MSNTKLNIDSLKNKLNSDAFKNNIEKISTVDSLIEYLKSENMEYKTYECFKMISDIPRNSGKEKAVSDFIKKFAEDRGYKTYQDEFHNVIVYVPASEGMEDRDSVMIQGHTDMVCVKESGNVHNFDTDSLELYTENGMLRAKGTTLGGDDGIAVAYMMSIMDNKKIKHPALECVFTSDEEGSFIGAENLDTSKLKSKTLINIDSEEEDVIIASCAGGMAFENRIKFERVESKLENPVAFKLKISGLKGGHSGSDIHRGRANAIKLAAEVLENIMIDNIEFELVSIESGEAPNVIPSKSETVILVEGKDLENVEASVEKSKGTIIKEYANSEYRIKIEVEKLKLDKIELEKLDSEKVELERLELKNIDLENVESKKVGQEDLRVVEKSAKDRLISWIKMFKNGVLTMSEDIEDLVESSDNLGTITTLDEEIIILNECRSCSDLKISEIKSDMEKLSNDTNTEMEKKYSYPGWAFRQESELRKSFNESVEKIYGRKSKELAVHSGLEVGFFVDGVEGLDAISIGPNMIDIHTPEEKLDIISALKIWYALLDFIAK